MNQAIDARDSASLQMLIKAKADVNTVRNGYTALHQAALMSKAEQQSVTSLQLRQ